LAAQLTARGHQVVVITPTRGARDVDGIAVHRIEAPLAPYFEFLTTRGGVRRIGRAIEDSKADVAHCHVSIVSPAGLGGARESERRGIPTVVTFHSVVPQTRLLARAAGAMLGTSKWRVRFSAVSRRVADDVSSIAPQAEMALLPNGIDVDFWRDVILMPAVPQLRSDQGRLRGPEDPLSSPFPSDRHVRLITVMRLNPKKRPLALVRLMRHLRTLIPGVSLQVVGDGPSRPSIERAIRRHGLEDRIELAGWQSRTEIRERFAVSDIFVLPAVRESFGIAALEARCAGLPVVAMRASGVAGLITHGVDGLLATSDESFVELTASLVNDAPRRAAIAAHNRSTRPPFDWPGVIDRHVELYREAIALRETV
jgi:glycosyltransferase involved in cell wall biosynthesis